MIDLRTERDQRRAALQPWICDGTLRDGRPCRKTLMELDPERPSYIRKRCERCGATNVWVEAYRPTDSLAWLTSLWYDSDNDIERS